MPDLIRKGEVHRWLVPSVLHVGFCQFAINVILQLSIGTVVESCLGPFRMALYYLLIMFGSNLFGATVSPYYSLGSEPIIEGFLGGLFAIILVYWNRISGTTCTRVCSIMMVVMVFVITTMLIS
jgi:membrane associated rhomboid family serine protease